MCWEQGRLVSHLSPGRESQGLQGVGLVRPGLRRIPRQAEWRQGVLEQDPRAACGQFRLRELQPQRGHLVRVLYREVTIFHHSLPPLLAQVTPMSWEVRPGGATMSKMVLNCWRRLRSGLGAEGGPTSLLTGRDISPGLGTRADNTRHSKATLVTETQVSRAPPPPAQCSVLCRRISLEVLDFPRPCKCRPDLGQSKAGCPDRRHLQVRLRQLSWTPLNWPDLMFRFEKQCGAFSPHAGPGKDEPNYPTQHTVHTRVQRHLPWIKKTIS